MIYHRIHVFTLECLVLLNKESLETGELRTCQTSTELKMGDQGSTEEYVIGILSGNVKGQVLKTQTLFQEAVNEQIRGFVSPLSRQLEDLTRLV